jgi:hypothetical protein
VVCAVRESTNFALDDLTFVVTHFLPHLNCDSVWRILKAEGLNRRRPPVSEQPIRGKGTFGDYDLGFVHIDIKHLPKLQTAYNACRQRVLEGKTPDQVVKERLRARRKLTRPKPEAPEGLAGPDDIARARQIAEGAKEVSQPDI